MPELFTYTYRLIKIDLNPGMTDFEFVVDGKKITYASPSDGPELSIRLQLKSNDQIPIRPQGTISAPFQRIYVSAAAVAKSIYLLISSPEVSLESRDVNVNNIALVSLVNTLTSITDPVISKEYQLDRALAGQLFEHSTLIAASGGNYSAAQVLNPAASGKTVIVLDGYLDTGITAAFGSELTITQHSTPLTTLVGTFLNAKSGLPNSVAQLRTENPAGWPGVTIRRIGLPTTGYVPTYFPPLLHVLTEGKGLCFLANAVNVNTRVNLRILQI